MDYTIKVKWSRDHWNVRTTFGYSNLGACRDWDQACYYKKCRNWHNFFQRLNSHKEVPPEPENPASGPEPDSPASSPEPQNLENLVYLKQALASSQQEIPGKGVVLNDVTYYCK